MRKEGGGGSGRVKPEHEVHYAEGRPEQPMPVSKILLIGDHEVDLDLIAESPDGQVVGAEAKMAASITNADVRRLVWLRVNLPDDFVDVAVLTTGTHAYRRLDGVAVVPLALLAPEPSVAPFPYWSSRSALRRRFSSAASTGRRTQWRAVGPATGFGQPQKMKPKRPNRLITVYHAISLTPFPVALRSSSCWGKASGRDDMTER